jgi:hypothetical protein
VSSQKEQLRHAVRDNLSEVMSSLNSALRGENLETLESVIARLARDGQLPHWYEELRTRKTIANLDGKTIGSILEMLLVAVLETSLFAKDGLILRVNAARSVDLPDLDLGVKSPSKNYCTSEPFFSAYERLYGNEHDCLVLLTDYQEAKKSKGHFKLQVESWKYMKGSEVADQELCRIALTHRQWLVSHDESTAKRVFRFLCFVNQGDWRARWLLLLLDRMADDVSDFNKISHEIERDYTKQNKIRAKRNREPLPEADLIALRRVFAVTPRYLGVINQLDNWVTEFLKDASRAPNDNEWARILQSPLDGKIGMSFALQWRYNFGKVFGGIDDDGIEA